MIVQPKLNSRSLEIVKEISDLVLSEGGRAYLVGGAVRDGFLGKIALDADVEVFRVPQNRLISLLSQKFKVNEVGESFGVVKVENLIDVSVPRREIKTGPRHQDFEIEQDPWTSIEEAASRRDFTVNAMMINLIDNGLEDPFGGLQDLESKRLVATSERFVEDPLRVLRGMQFAARFNLRPDLATIKMCRGLSINRIAPERVYEEWKKLILLGDKISLGLDFLGATDWIRFFPELRAMVGCQQEPEWHPEGDVWTHTGHVMDEFAKERIRDEWEDLVVGFACLTHDMGKPLTTKFETGRWRSKGHSEAGIEPMTRFVSRMTNQADLIDQLKPLILEHQAPYELFKLQANDRSVRRLARRVGRIDRLCRLSKADNNGRPPRPRQDPDECTVWLLDRAKDLQVEAQGPVPIILGRHLIGMGYTPGPLFGEVLSACLEAQIEGEFSTLEEGLDFLQGSPLLATFSNTGETQEKVEI